MVKKIGTLRSKTRSKLKKGRREKGKISLSRYFQEFKEGDKVALIAEPSVHKGIYHPRFHSRTGVIKSKTGSCYYVTIKDRNKEKVLIVHPVHLKRV